MSTLKERLHKLEGASRVRRAPHSLHDFTDAMLAAIVRQTGADPYNDADLEAVANGTWRQLSPPASAKKRGRSVMGTGALRA